MEATQALEKLRTELGKVKDTGQSEIDISALEDYLEALSKDAGTSMELQKMEYQRSLAHYDAQTRLFHSDVRVCARSR